MYVDDFPHFSHQSRAFEKRIALAEAQNWRCAYCGIAVQIEVDDRDTRLSIDEVVPRCAGGLRVWSNQVIACALCNQGRGAMRAERYFGRVQEEGRLSAYAWGVNKWHEAVRRKQAKHG